MWFLRFLCVLCGQNVVVAVTDRSVALTMVEPRRKRRKRRNHNQYGSSVSSVSSVVKHVVVAVTDRSVARSLVEPRRKRRKRRNCYNVVPPIPPWFSYKRANDQV